jgi:ADP-heptose:LPS heptosyltransferase
MFLMKLDESEVKRIGVFRALQLGDMLCSIPAIRALRASYPKAEITLLGLPWASSLAKRFSKYFDRFIHFPGYPGLPEQAYDSAQFASFEREVKQRPFDLLLQMQGKGTIVNELLSSWNAKYLAGFRCKDAFVESELFTDYPDGIHEVERHLSLMAHIGAQPLGTDMEFELDDNDRREFEKLDVPISARQYVCIHPGSRDSNRQWSSGHFADVADYCQYQGLQVVITGSKDETAITSKVVSKMRERPVDLTGRTTLGSLAVLIKNACLLISNCTGVSHIAAALRTPSVIISMDGEPARWGPLNKELHSTIDCRHDPRFGQVMMEVIYRLNQSYDSRQAELLQRFSQ